MRTVGIPNRRRRRRRVVLGCGSVLLLLVSGLVVTARSFTGLWPWQDPVKELRAQLYRSGDIHKLKSYSQALRLQDTGEILEPPDELRAIGVSLIVVHDFYGDRSRRRYQFEFRHSVLHYGVIIAPPDYQPEGSEYTKWEDGVYGFEMWK